MELGQRAAPTRTTNITVRVTEAEGDGMRFGRVPLLDEGLPLGHFSVLSLGAVLFNEPAQFHELAVARQWDGATWV
ncbi:MAG: hypothetical protein GY745_18960 [Actinomycetia bacterium]|nr:hypothetical protein [Actinomycetes bacterium]